MANVGTRATTRLMQFLLTPAGLSENLAAVIWSSSIMPMLRATAAESLVTLMS